MIFGCPGSRKFKRPWPEELKCRNCGAAVEVWTDEFEYMCPGCGIAVRREGAQSCLDWCKEAKKCVGESVYLSYINKRNGGG